MSEAAPLASPGDDCSVVNQDSTNYNLRIAALFAILGASTIGGCLPLITRRAKLDSLFFYGTVFAGGVVMATGFVHILPDAADDMSNPCLGLSTTYPWAYVIAGAASLLTFMAEYFLKQIIRRKLGLSAQPIYGHAHGEHTADIEVADPNFPTGGEAKQQLLAAQHAENRVAAIMLESGVIFHSIFIGIDLGINPDPSVVRPLMIALMFHQGFEGFALGATFIRANFSTFKYLCYLVAFVLVTPVGIAIGIGVGSSYHSNGKLALGFQGSFNSVSAGILIYNGLVDLLLPTFLSATMLVGRSHLQLVAMTFMFVGYACMSLLAKWA